MSNRKRPRHGGGGAPLAAEVVTFNHPVTGQLVLAVLPAIPDTAPQPIKEGLSRRRLAVTTGRCPCGATFTPPVEPEAGSVTRAEIAHENNCEAITESLIAAIRRWQR